MSMEIFSKNKIKCTVLRGLTILAGGMALLPATSQKAQACCFCDLVVNLMDPMVWEEAEEEFDEKLNDEFIRMERFFVHEFWEQRVLPSMMLMAEQFTVVAIQQAMAIGTFIDAQNQLETQQLLQELRARAHKDYHPSTGMCEFGSLMKGIASSERLGEMTSIVLSQRSQDRQVGAAYSSGNYGEDLDQQNRIAHFANTFCDEKDRDSALTGLCSALVWDGSFTPEERNRMDKDIDYFSLIDSPWTLSIDFTNRRVLDTTSTPNVRNQDEENVFAIASNLFGHELFPRPPVGTLFNDPQRELTSMQRAFMEMRSILAKRSVAENSFNAIASMKAEGIRYTPPSGTVEPNRSRVFMQSVLEGLGVPSADVLRILGDNPSYHAQMEVLTKKLYQNPKFFTDLYDKPANVERKGVALQAIKLMQKFDMLKSFLRNEATFSVLLELAVIELQGEIEDQIKGIETSIQ